MDQVAAILLAAGRSKRMGAFKPLLPFGDSTVIEHCLDNLRHGGVGQIVVVLGHRADEICRQLEQRNLSFVFNPDPSSEMSASIACGIQALHASSRAVLVALSDQPAIPATVVPRLIEHWTKGAKIVKPEHQGRGGHPVLIDLTFRNELMSLSQEGGLRGFLASQHSEVCRLEVESPLIARDMDTWDDYVSLHEEVFGVGPGLQAGKRPN
jgi:molybdenum cofactor cytidylyltransferase